MKLSDSKASKRAVLRGAGELHHGSDVPLQIAVDAFDFDFDLGILSGGFHTAGAPENS